MSTRDPHGAVLEVDDPYTGAIAARVPLATGGEVDRVLDRAREGAKIAASLSVDVRVALASKVVESFEKHADAIAAEITAQMGKPLAQAQNEIAGMAKRARYMAAIAKESLGDMVLPPMEGLERRIVRTPLGVVFALPAWNYPLLTAVNVVVPAVLAGNAVVLKHSPRTPLVGDAFARAFEEAGIDPRVVQALQCDHATSGRIAGDRRIDHVAFTGSVLGGREIQKAAAAGTRGRFVEVGLELGGNDAAYVAEDADLAQAIDGIVDGACYNAGQSCCAVERAYVHRSKYDAFVEGARALMEKYVMGDPRAASTTLGPIAQPWHVAELEAQVKDAIARGGKVVLGGRAQQVDGKGRFFQPTLLVGMAEESDVLSKESFGPILPVVAVNSDEEALSRIDDDDLGLTASVWTKDRDRAARMAARLEVGTVYMNRCDALDPALPWIGVKESGKGSTLSTLGFMHLTRPKAWNFRVG